MFAVAPPAQTGFTPCPPWCELPLGHVTDQDEQQGFRIHRRHFGDLLELLQVDDSEPGICLHAAEWSVTADAPSEAAEHLHALAEAAATLGRLVATRTGSALVMRD